MNMSIDKQPRKVGRPTIMTADVLAKLRNAFSFACPDEEACAYAGISVDVLYDFQRANPEFAKEKRELKMKPQLAVRQMLVKNIDKDLAHARWYATKKLPREFGEKMEVTTTVVHKLNLNLADAETREAIHALDAIAKKDLRRPPNEIAQEAQESLDTQ